MDDKKRVIIDETKNVILSHIDYGDKINYSNDLKIKPNYYNLDGCSEVWDVENKILNRCETFQLNPMVFKLWCSAFEYIFRCGVKGDMIRDIKKAITNLEKIVEILEKR